MYVLIFGWAYIVVKQHSNKFNNDRCIKFNYIVIVNIGQTKGVSGLA